MVNEISIFIMVAAAVTVVTMGLMLFARRFKGQQNNTDNTNSAPLPFRPNHPHHHHTVRRVVEYRPTDRLVKPYNTFTEPELDLLEKVTLTKSNVEYLAAAKPIDEDNKSKVEIAVEDEECDKVAIEIDHGLLHYASPECSICLTAYRADDEVRVLTCDHAYHTGCIDVWLTQKSSRCPICKTDIRESLGLEPRKSKRKKSSEPPSSPDNNAANAAAQSPPAVISSPPAVYVP